MNKLLYFIIIIIIIMLRFFCRILSSLQFWNYANIDYLKVFGELNHTIIEFGVDMLASVKLLTFSCLTLQKNNNR